MLVPDIIIVKVSRKFTAACALIVFENFFIIERFLLLASNAEIRSTNSELKSGLIKYAKNVVNYTDIMVS